jgi:DNA-binding transcriptional regulator LsrR (DeoR family)
MVAVGSWDREGSQLCPMLEPVDHEALARQWVAAEMCTMLFGPEGRLLKTPLTRRAMAFRTRS